MFVKRKIECFNFVYQTAQTVVTVDIIDINDNKPVFDKTVYTFDGKREKNYVLGTVQVCMDNSYDTIRCDDKLLALVSSALLSSGALASPVVRSTSHVWFHVAVVKMILDNKLPSLAGKLKYSIRPFLL